MAQNVPPVKDETSGWDINRVMMIAGGVLVGVFVLIFVVALVLALTNERASTIIAIFRDVFLIVLALQGIAVSMAFVVFVVQVARFINLLTSEFRPILEQMQATVKEAQTTVEFVSANTIKPLMRISAFFAGLATFFRELANIRKAIRPTAKKGTANDSAS
ncbi:MAG: hypothetical protein HXY40_05870 [Chloroflexi bacterium]|nr:hypothetical protein [Chloroflexota bacterium]